MSSPSQDLIRRHLVEAKLVFGATSLGNLFREIPESDKGNIVASWVQSGVQPLIIDSAGKYGAGLSLEVIGRQLDRLEVPADRVLVSNKLAWRRKPLTTPEPTFEPGAWFGLEHDAQQDISYEGILRCFEEGNQLLGRSAQIVSVHDPDEYLATATDAKDRTRRLEDILGAYRALTELREAGKVLAVGVGSKTWQTIQELSQHVQLDWAMFANSCTIMHHPPELLEFMQRIATEGTAIINSALFHGGFLLGGDFFDYRRVTNSAADQAVLNWRARFQNICSQHRVSAFEAGVAFGLGMPGVTAVALSSSRAERVSSHVQAVSAASSIPVDFWQALQAEELIEQAPAGT